jgi:solute carrier family 45 protein 1/2/4
MCFVWAKFLIKGLLDVFGVEGNSDGVKITTIAFAVLCFYVLDFAINTCKLEAPIALLVT